MLLRPWEPQSNLPVLYPTPSDHRYLAQLYRDHFGLAQPVGPHHCHCTDNAKCSSFSVMVSGQQVLHTCPFTQLGSQPSRPLSHANNKIGACSGILSEQTCLRMTEIDGLKCREAQISRSSAQLKCAHTLPASLPLTATGRNTGRLRQSAAGWAGAKCCQLWAKHTSPAAERV